MKSFSNKKNFFKSFEGLIFLIGCVLLICEAMFFSGVLGGFPDLKERIISVVIADLLGGRGASISLGLELGLSRSMIILISVVFNLTWLFVFYPLILRFYEELEQSKFFRGIFRSTKRTAEKHQSKIEKWGILGYLAEFARSHKLNKNIYNQHIRTI